MLILSPSCLSLEIAWPLIAYLQDDKGARMSQIPHDQSMAMLDIWWELNGENGGHLPSNKITPWKSLGIA